MTYLFAFILPYEYGPFFLLYLQVAATAYGTERHLKVHSTKLNRLVDMNE